MVTALSRNGIVCLTCKAVECILMNNYTNPLGKNILPCPCIIWEGFFLFLWDLFSYLSRLQVYLSSFCQVA